MGQSFLFLGQVAIKFTFRLSGKLPSIPCFFSALKDDLMPLPSAFYAWGRGMLASDAGFAWLTSSFGALPGSLSSWALTAAEQGKGCKILLQLRFLLFYWPLTTAPWEMPDGHALEHVFSMFN